MLLKDKIISKNKNYLIFLINNLFKTTRKTERIISIITLKIHLMILKNVKHLKIQMYYMKIYFLPLVMKKLTYWNLELMKVNLLRNFYL